MEAVFKAPELDDFLLSPVLGDQITDSTLMHSHLPKQADIDRVMDKINRKYLAKLQLPCSIRDMQATYLSSTHFRDIYLSAGMNKMPSKARSARKLESDLMNAIYMIHGGLLYRYMKTNTGYFDPVLCVPAHIIPDVTARMTFMHKLNLYVHNVLERKIRLYEWLLQHLEELLDSIGILSIGHLPPLLFPSTVLKNITDNAMNLVHKLHPDYVLAIDHVTAYMI